MRYVAGRLVYFGLRNPEDTPRLRRQRERIAREVLAECTDAKANLTSDELLQRLARWLNLENRP